MVTSGRTDAGGLHVEEEVGDALVLGGLGVCPGEEDHAVGVLCAGGPDLLAVDDVVVAVADAGLREARSEPDSGSEKPCTRWPHRRACPEYAPASALGAVGDDRAGHGDADAAGPRRTGEGELLVEDELFHDGHARSAVLLGPGGGDPAAGGELFHPGLVGVHGGLAALGGGLVGAVAASPVAEGEFWMNSRTSVRKVAFRACR